MASNFDIVSFIVNSLFAILIIFVGLYLKSLYNDNKTLKNDIDNKLKLFQSKELCESKHKGIDIITRNIQDDIKEIKQDIKEGFFNVYKKIDDKTVNFDLLISSLEILNNTMIDLSKKKE